MKLVYLAVPYSHKDPAVEQYRFDTVNRVAADLMKRGYAVFSPITQSVVLKQVGDLPKTWDYWKQIDTVFLKRCDILVVLMLDGWAQSVGVQAEIEIAKANSIPIFYITAENLNFHQTPERSTP